MWQPSTLSSDSVYLKVLQELSTILVCAPQHFLKHCKLSLLANITQSSDPVLQELALQLYFDSELLQINDNHCGILTQAREQLSTIPSAKKLCLASKKVATAKEKALCTDKLESLSVQCKFKDAAFLETSTHLWNRLLLAGQLSEGLL